MVASRVVIPTQMWASATSTLNKNINLIRVVIPTQMWASATLNNRGYEVTIKSCHTHSNVGFCNEPITWFDKQLASCHTHSNVGFCNIGIRNILSLIQVVIPTQMWASAT